MGMFGSVSSLLTEKCHEIYQIRTIGAATKLDGTQKKPLKTVKKGINEKTNIKGGTDGQT